MNDPYEVFDLIDGIITKRGLEGFDAWMAGLDEDTHEEILDALSDPAYRLAPYQRMPSSNPKWIAWYLGKYGQLPPDEWRVWFLRMGRGAGKTHAAACAVHHLAQHVFPGGSGILVGFKYADVRDTMIFGSSGLIATAPEGFVPVFNKHDNSLTWPNGTKCIVRTSDNPEDLRGYTVNFAWADEGVKWRSPMTWDNLDRCVRELHENGTRIILTSTPKRGKEWLREIERDPATITSTATSLDNPFQDKAALEKRKREQEAGGNKASEEINGEWTEGLERLWTPSMIDAWRIPASATKLSLCHSMTKTLMSIDPSKGVGKDLTGIMIQGIKQGKVYQISDETTASSYAVWINRVVELAAQYLRPQDVVLVEENNFLGIDQTIRDKLREKGLHMRVEVVSSQKDKWTRATMAFSHCLSDKVRFYGNHGDLEQQLCDWDPEQKDSPDRGDAFAQGVKHLLEKHGSGLASPVITLEGFSL